MARSIDRRGVKDWFAGLNFELQKSVLDDFASTYEASKEKRISALETELAALRGGRSGAEAKPGPKPSSKKGVKVPPKYVDKATGKTWAGRGVQPAWVQDHLKRRGAKLDDLLIAKK